MLKLFVRLTNVVGNLWPKPATLQSITSGCRHKHDPTWFPSRYRAITEISNRSLCFQSRAVYLKHLRSFALTLSKIPKILRAVIRSYLKESRTTAHWLRSKNIWQASSVIELSSHNRKLYFIVVDRRRNNDSINKQWPVT